MPISYAYQLLNVISLIIWLYVIYKKNIAAKKPPIPSIICDVQQPRKDIPATKSICMGNMEMKVNNVCVMIIPINNAIRITHAIEFCAIRVSS